MALELDTFGITALILALAATVAFLAHRARQPLIIAFIVVGIVVGPSALDWVHEAEALELFAEIGIAILLFLVGLKLDVNLVRSVGPVALATGLGQIVIMAIVGFGISLLFGLDLVAAAVVGVAITFSSTIIVVKLLTDHRQLDQLHGRVALGLLIVQDVVVIIVMIVLTSIGTGAADGASFDLGAEALRILLGGGGLLVGIGVAMRWVLPWLLDRVATSQELLIVWSVAWAIGVAALTDVLGFSIEVGAFLAGFALASTRYREQVHASLSGLRDFLLLFFFIVLGAELDFAAIGAQVPLAIALSIFVLVGTPIIMIGIMSLMGYPARVGFLAGLAIAQISEFSLILIALTRDIGLVDDDIVGLVTLVALITIAGSSYLIPYSERFATRLEPLLSRLQRRTPRTAPASDEQRYDAIVFGHGRFGSQLIRELVGEGCRVLLVEWDPFAEVRLQDAELADRVDVVFGDARSPEFPETLPVHDARFIITTVPDVDTNLVLAAALRRAGATCPIAVTVHTDGQAHLYRQALIDGTVSTVLHPFREAADDAMEALKRLEAAERDDD
ncbi:MAG: sodium:proton exchanger [Microbacterium sp.]|nr:sodium:proton exchanger [Microbacterium sp.]MBA4345643.1 sodium:proton exchanger [Microbacterium sp.]